MILEAAATRTPLLFRDVCRDAPRLQVARRRRSFVFVGYGQLPAHNAKASSGSQTPANLAPPGPLYLAGSLASSEFILSSSELY